jgi:threonine dehydrogenase-like Zn-dependent dehydrogenase
LNIARQVGIDAVCNVKKETLSDAVKRAFGRQGFQVGAEVAGVDSSLSALVAGVEKGGTILAIGVFGRKPEVDMSVVCEHELDVKGSMMYRHEDWVEAVKWMASGRIKTSQLDSRHFKFGEYPSAYSFIEAEADKVMKVMIDIAD